jgi:hypothetical protein
LGKEVKMQIRAISTSAEMAYPFEKRWYWNGSKK